MREEHRTGLFRGLVGAGLASAIAFFNLWPQDVTSQVLISTTVLAGLVPLGTFLGYGVRDARRNGQG